MVTSAARPSAPRAAAGKDVAIEKKTTVPPGAVARMAPPSQPGTSTQTTVMSAAPPVAATASRRAIGSRASATTTLSASPLAGGQAERPGLARAADHRDHGALGGRARLFGGRAESRPLRHDPRRERR